MLLRFDFFPKPSFGYFWDFTHPNRRHRTHPLRNHCHLALCPPLAALVLS
jgi:hypothetical protein